MGRRSAQHLVFLLEEADPLPGLAQFSVVCRDCAGLATVLDVGLSQFVRQDSLMPKSVAICLSCWPGSQLRATHTTSSLISLGWDWVCTSFQWSLTAPEIRCHILVQRPLLPNNTRRGTADRRLTPIALRKKAAMQPTTAHPVQFSVDYPDRNLNRWSTALRIVAVIPIAFVLGAVSASSWQWDNTDTGTAQAIGAGGLLFLAPLLMIVFRQKYPRWWFDWNLELLRFSNRVGIYLALMDDQYPSTDEHQSVHLEYPYPEVERDLNRWLPLVKWLLAIPHYIVLFFLYIATVIVVIIAWFAILITGRYPRGIFDFVEGVIRWHNRVIGYALVMVTDQYPPFRLAA